MPAGELRFVGVALEVIARAVLARMLETQSIVAKVVREALH